MTPPIINNRKALEDLGKGMTVPTLGMTVTWDVDPNLLIPQDEMITLLQQYSLDSDVKLPKIRTRKALRRALEDMAGQNLLRMILNDQNHTVYALVRESVDQNTEEPTYERHLKVSVWKDLDNLPPLADPDGLQFHDPIGTPLGTARNTLRPLIDKYQQTYTAQDISECLFLNTVWEKDGITLRNQGGAYFIPERHRDLFERLASFAQVLAAQKTREVYLHLYSVFGYAAEKANLSKRVVPTLLGLVDEAARELAKIEQREKDGARIRPETIVSHLQNAEELRQRAELYRDLLNMDIGKVNQAIDVLVAGLEKVRRGDDSVYQVFDEQEASPENPFADEESPSVPDPDIAPADLELPTLDEPEPEPVAVAALPQSEPDFFDEAEDDLPDFDFDEDVDLS